MVFYMLRFFNKRIHNRKGFTLIELIVVIAILGILALVAVPRFAQVQKNARIDADKATANQIVNAAKVYIADKNLNTDALVRGVDIAKLVTAGLIDAAPKAQTNGADMVLAVTGTVAAPIFTVTATDTIIPTATGVFIKP